MAKKPTRENGLRIRRPRLDAMRLGQEDRVAIVNRVLNFYKDDLYDSRLQRDMQMQRYAKYRMWRGEDKDWPWEGASDAQIPDMMANSQRVQDTLLNAFQSAKPAIVAKELTKGDQPGARGELVTNLIDFQFFVEGHGEDVVAAAAESFCNDPCCTVMTQWVEDRRNVYDAQIFPPLPANELPEVYFRTLIPQGINDIMPETLVVADSDGWTWKGSLRGRDGKASDAIKIDFYTRPDDGIEMVFEREVEIFNGPTAQVLNWDDVLCGARAANLQIPMPSNPRGAPHVIVRSNPVKDEIIRLVRSGYYDLVDIEDIKGEIEAQQKNDIDDEEKIQKDVFQGAAPGIEDKSRIDLNHEKLTLLRCFDIMDIDGDGISEDVVFWVILESKLLLRARRLTEVYPSNPPRRPFAEKSFLPVKDRRHGISMLEMLEGLHDLAKMSYDQMVDGSTLSILPFFFYRASGGMQPQTIRLWPGEGYPLSDPSKDVNFPRIENQAMPYGINMLTLLNSMEERLTLQSEMSFGRVPAGRSSALRTTGNMAMLQSQGEERPERILRRFFSMFTEVWAQFHELNQRFLPENKEIRINRPHNQQDEIFLTIDDPVALKGRFTFDFTANAFNASRAALQNALREILGVIVNPLSIQLGVVTPDNFYRAVKDYIEALGQDAKRYTTPPSPLASKTPILFEEALAMIMDGNVPDGVPAEPGGPLEQLQKLTEFVQSDQMGLLQTPAQQQAFQQYMLFLVQMVQAQQQQQALMQAAQSTSQQLGQDRGGGQGGRPAMAPPQGGGGGPGVQQGPNDVINPEAPAAGAGAVQ